MSKGSWRRPENTEAIEANWPFPDRARHDVQQVPEDPQQSSESRNDSDSSIEARGL